MTKRVNHVVLSPDQSSSALDAHKKDSSIPPLLNSGLSPGAPPPPPPTVIHTKEDMNTNMQDDVVENPEGGGVLTRGSNEEPQNRTFDQVLASLAELTEKHCETVQVNTVCKDEIML